MKKNNIKHLDLDLYYEKLKNGLEIFIIPKNNVNDVFVTYTTKFGSNNTEFIPINGSDYIKVPNGIAHFLEHKMFEDEDVSIFEKFEKNGANCNAYTTYENTTYLFESPTNFEKNLEILLSYVNRIHLTNENVEKEKGIIIQEIMMGNDEPFRNGLETLNKNCFKNDPIKEPITGNKKDVENTTKEELITCYKTFYNPNNMFIVITGNVKPKKTISLIKNKLNKLNNSYIPKLKEFDESDEIVKDYDEKNMNVTIPKLFYGIKIKKDYKDIDKFKNYLNIYLDSILGTTSNFNEKLKEKKLIIGDIDYVLTEAKYHILISICVETKCSNKIIKLFDNIFKEIPDKKTFERKKKIFISEAIELSENIIGINRFVINKVLKYNSFNPNYFDNIKKLKYEEFKEIIRQINFKNKSILLINPKKKK